ncbi:thiamine phosphate synthase [Paenimyroides baculatum]|uniref:Thiamine-phosphate synthase n=1 Tax=Paenimyroides baculatum TaxID=2608000 RepID=A0A5M6CAA0_9FLAO|nr:thiamine phosphate synthase [Paenimyroides baculatum]KAA5532078.1 thiamine phosphate synthase [Paenimyroides baculatum]
MISRLHYISQGYTALEQEQNIRKVLDNGADWIQLRWKEASEKELLQLSEKLKMICESYRATFIINDHVQVAKAIDADGVHLGLDDESIANARAVLGSHKIIGGTANTLENVRQRITEGCDYIGLGPYQFTTTKEKLSPILGLEGYQAILQSLQDKNIEYPPIIAIGGIKLNDIESIKHLGIYGVALSGLLTQNPSILPQIQTV